MDMINSDENRGLPFKELDSYYRNNFSLGYLNTDINTKFALISLICYVTYKTQMKKPDTTYYQVIMKLSTNLGLPEKFIKALAIICQDFGYGCTTFPLFNIDEKKIIPTIRELLKQHLPF